MYKLIVDSRESQSGLAALLSAKGADVVSEELEVGDYVLAEGLAVERKTAVDFIASILDRRIFSQVQALKSTYLKPFIVVEGDLFRTRSAISEEALLGAMSYISVIEGLPILTTSGIPQTASLLLTMQRHALAGLGYDIPLRGAKPKDRSAQSQFLVEGLVGIGPTAAKKLLAHFGSAHAVFMASATELKAVPGMGPKTVATIQDVLHNVTR